jgi:hypothetical protein
MDETLGGSRNFIHGLIERGFVRTRGSRRTAQFPDELQGGCPNLPVCRWRLKVRQSFDVPAHDAAPRIVNWGLGIGD